MARTAVANRVASTRKPFSLLFNGDFELAPSFTAATTSAAWIDGTASGSTANLSEWEWGMGLTGSAAAQFDDAESHSGTYSMKLSTTAVASFAEVRKYASTGNIQKYQRAVPVVDASTAYTCTYWMKTNYVSGDASTGARIDITQRNAAGGGITTNSGTAVKTTTDWTQYTISFTSNASTRFLDIKLIVYGHQGTATLIMDAWFDDIRLFPTTLPARVAASGRTTP